MISFLSGHFVFFSVSVAFVSGLVVNGGINFIFEESHKVNNIKQSSYTPVFQLQCASFFFPFLASFSIYLSFSTKHLYISFVIFFARQCAIYNINMYFFLDSLHFSMNTIRIEYTHELFIF